MENLIVSLDVTATDSLKYGTMYLLSSVKKKMEHITVHPSTRQKMLVPPKMEIKFKPSATIKDKLK